MNKLQINGIYLKIIFYIKGVNLVCEIRCKPHLIKDNTKFEITEDGMILIEKFEYPLLNLINLIK